MKQLIIEKIEGKRKGYYLYKTKCLYCGKTNIVHGYVIRRGGGYFCDRKCSGLYRSVKKLKFICKICGKPVYRYPCEVNKKNNYFCSYKCMWKGNTVKYNNRVTGKSYTGKGYITIRCKYHPNAKNGYVSEHRLVMEKYLKRFLKPTEVVHHIDGNIKNNHLDNLFLFKNKSEHKIWHDTH